VTDEHVRLRARVTLRRPEYGGRTNQVRTGYRSLVRFAGSSVDHGFELELDPALEDGLPPGATGTVKLSIWFPSGLRGATGEQFEIREGQRVIGTGIVLD